MDSEKRKWYDLVLNLIDCARMSLGVITYSLSRRMLLAVVVFAATLAFSSHSHASNEYEAAFVECVICNAGTQLDDAPAQTEPKLAQTDRPSSGQPANNIAAPTRRLLRPYSSRAPPLI